MACLLVSIAPTALAQGSGESSGSPWDGIEEMIVYGGEATALIIEQTSSAISFDAAQIQVERIEDISDLSNFTPNLEIKSPNAASNPTLFIRGVGLDDFNANSASAVAVYQDGVYMNSPAGQLFQFFDVAGVDVLRGPHAGRYRNASAGAIRVQSNVPTNEFQSYASFTTGNYGLVETEGALNIPIVSDVLMFRVAGRMQQRDGITKNRCDGKPLLRFNDPSIRLGDRSCTRIFAPGFSLGDQRIRNRANDAENWAIRGQFLWQVPLRDSSMEWLLNLHGGRNESQAAMLQHRGFGPSSATPFAPKIPREDTTGYFDTDDDPFAGDYNNGDDENLALFGVNLKGTWEVSDVHTIESLSAYEWHDRNTLENTDANPRNLLTSQYRDDAWQFSQDLRIDSVWSDVFETHFGIYFLLEDLNVDNAFELQTLFILDLEYTQELRSGAVYGEVKWEFFPTVEFDATIRYTHEYKEFDNFSTANNSAGVSGVGLNIGTANETFSDVSGHAGLTWYITEEHSIYAKYTRGWKPGHFNGGSVFSGQLIEPVAPEEIHAGELGFKTSWFEGRAVLEMAGFVYDFTNLQIFALEQDAGSFPLSQLINAEGAEIFGAEAQVFLEPIEGLQIEYNVAFLDTEYTKFVNTLFRVPPSPPGTPPPDPVFIDIDYTGNRMIGSPEWSMSGSIQYVLDLSRLGILTPRFSFSWKDDSFYDAAEGKGTLQDLPDGTIGQKAFGIINASLGWVSPQSSIGITGWVRNIANEEVKVQSFDVSDGFNFVIDAYAAPRTYGVTFRLTY